MSRPSPSISTSTSTSINMNIILSLVISLGFLLSECVCVGQTLNCGCSTSCTSNILDSFAGEYTCRDRINYLINSESYTEANACRLVAGTEFPCVCGPFCDPDRCDTAIVPRTPAPTQPPAPAPSSLYCFPDDDGNGSRVTYTNMWDGDFTVQVKEGNVCGPGGNRFTQDTVSVSTSTGNQALVLQFKKNGAFWEASEVRIIKPDNSPFKYGEYSFHVNSVKVKDSSNNIISNVLPANIVLGLFTWDPTDDYAMHQNWNHEVDIEISKWGIPDNKDVQFLMQPPGDPQMYRFYSGDGTNTYDQSDQTYSFNWLPNKISWSSTAGGGQTHIYTTEDAVLKGCTDYVQCLPADIEIRINLWSIDGLTAAPQGLSDTDSIEVVLDDFTYQESNVEYASPGDYCSKHCQCEAELGCVNGQCITIVTPPTPTPEPTQSPTQHPTPAAPTTSPTPEPTQSPTQHPTPAAPTTSPTPEPTQSPTQHPTTAAPTTSEPTPQDSVTSCNDSSYRFRTFKKSGKRIWRDCIWVKTRSTETRCSFDGVSAMCPNTCGSCDVCVDSNLRMKFYKDDNKKITRDCSWTSVKPNRCNIDGMKDSCRDTCNHC